MSSYAHAESVSNYIFSNSPLDRSPNSQPGRCGENSLSRPFEAGTNVVLVSGGGICSATVAGTCTYRDPNYGLRQGANLAVEDECRGAGGIAIVDLDRNAVRSVSPQVNLSPMPKDIESKARQLVQEYFDEEARRLLIPHQVLSSRPVVLRVEQVALLNFEASGGWRPAVILVNNDVFPLAGHSCLGYFFFTVENRLHLAYSMSFMMGDRSHIVICDLSGGSPRYVYDSTDVVQQPVNEPNESRQ